MKSILFLKKKKKSGYNTSCICIKNLVEMLAASTEKYVCIPAQNKSAHEWRCLCWLLFWQSLCLCM